MSFSLDFVNLWNGAGVIVEGISPAVLTIGGIVLGVTILGIVVKSVRGGIRF